MLIPELESSKQIRNQEKPGQCNSDTLDHPEESAFHLLTLDKQLSDKYACVSDVITVCMLTLVEHRRFLGRRFAYMGGNGNGGRVKE